MPNPYTSTKFKFDNLVIQDIPPMYGIVKFLFTSFLFHIFDNKYFNFIINIVLIFYIFLPIFYAFNIISWSFLNYQSNWFIVNFLNSIIDVNKSQMLTTLYLSAPLIALYFKEHGTIIDEFMSKYKTSNKDNEDDKIVNESLLDINKDNYDRKDLPYKMSKIFANRRTLGDKYKFVNSYINWAIIIGEKRKISSNNLKMKILLIVSLLIVGMPMSLSLFGSKYYILSLGFFVLIMGIIVCQIVFVTRSIYKLSLLNDATHAAYYFYEKDQKDSTLL